MADRGAEVQLLPAVNDAFGGVIVEMKTPMDASAFLRSLRASMDNWRQQVCSMKKGWK